MSIPTDITYTGLTVNFDINPGSSKNFEIDLRSSDGVDGAIDAFKAQMLDQNWTLTGESYARTSLSCAGLVGSSSTGFSIVLTYYLGSTLQFYTPPEPDPSGNPGAFPGTFILGIEAFDGATQAELMGLLAAAMDSLSMPNYRNESDGVGTIEHIANFPGPAYNGGNWIANLIGGYVWNGPTKGGGWQLTSLSTAEHPPVTVIIRNVHSGDYLSIDARINGNNCAQVLIQRRNNWLSVVSPFMWCLFRRNDGTTWSSGDIYTSYDNYWICAPEMDFNQRIDPDDPLWYAAFVFIRDRGSLNQAVGVTAINDAFHDGTFSAFDSDVGISLILLNSMQTAAGALTTTADKYLQIQALIALSPDAGEALQVVGNLWDMYLTSKYFALDTLAFSNSGKLVIAYRSQQAPCEWTLWLALN